MHFLQDFIKAIRLHRLEGCENLKPVWMVLNQSQNPTFQKMLEALADALGSCILFTGTPFPNKSRQLTCRKGPSYDRRGLLKRTKSWVVFTVAAFIHVLRTSGKPTILAVTNPPLLPHIAWILHKVFGYPYILLIWDIYPDHMERTGLIRAGGIVAKIWRELNRHTMRDAAAVITLGEKMAAVLRSQLGRDANSCRMEVIPNWVDTDFLRPLAKEKNPFARGHSQERKITVLYSGNMGLTHGLDSIIEAANILRHETGISFLLIGDGLGKSVVERKVRELDLGNVTILPFQSVSVLPHSLACGEITVITQSPGMEDLSMPSKTYSALAVGSAVLACTYPGSDLAETVIRNGAGLVCPQDDPDAIALSIKRLADDRHLLERCRANARKAALEIYDSRIVFERLHHLIRSCISKPSVSQ